MHSLARRTAGAIFAICAATLPATAQTYSADVPDDMLTPDVVETERLGTLRFFDGMPDKETVRKAYDNLDFLRGVDVFLQGMPAASIYAMCNGYAEAGLPYHSVGITENLLDARSLWLTANATTVYAVTCLDLSQGPIVLEVPPGLLGFVNDAFFRWVTDVGLTGPDQGRGGRYLIVPPGYDGALPEMGFHVVHSETYRHWMLGRALVVGGDVASAVDGIKAGTKVYRLAKAANPPEEEFINITGMPVNTLHPRSFAYYEEIDAMVQHEPIGAFPPEIAGLFASVGIEKGKPFSPDERMTEILTEAVAVGNATARAILFQPRLEEAFFYPGQQWYTSFIGGSHEFTIDGALLLDARTMFHTGATGITPAMTRPQVGSGSVYAFAAHDATGDYLDGSKKYSVTLPAPVPAKDFWSFTVYSPQHFSMLETDQRLAGLDSTLPEVEANEDGSYTIWFGPAAPDGREGNWIQTMPGQGFAILLRLYGPLEPWFEKTWKPGDLELIE